MLIVIYVMEHPTIEFSSLNKLQAALHQSLLKVITASDLLNKPLAGTHSLMLSMYFAGYFPLFETYIQKWQKDKTKSTTGDNDE